MNEVLLIAFITMTCIAIAASSPLTFDEWLKGHDKSYPTAADRAQRQLDWLENWSSVEKHNLAYEAGYSSFAMTMDSPFADLTAESFSAKYLMDPQDCSATTHTSSGSIKKRTDTNMDGPIDWRTKGIMTPIKNQGHCGSCWTFSTTGCLEAHLCLANKKDCTHWTGLAEQQLVDCAGDFNNNGCSGGLPSQAFEYIKYSGGLEFETSYPYIANETGTCSAWDGEDAVAKVQEVFNITSGDEDDLQHAVATVGPVSIAYQVSPDFRLYSHGVYDSYNATTNQTMCHDTPMDVNHAVVAVGLDKTADGVPFYIIRNSWGTSWGMEGHFWMKRGENLCGVSDCASFPLVPIVKKEGHKSTVYTDKLEKTVPKLRAVAKN
jgi:cathepsin H